MKKLSTIIMALALVLGMSQCKKQETPTTGNTTPTNPGVHITVNVGDQDGKDGKDNNGEKHNIAPQYGLFSFSNGDVLYVGHGGKFVGTLTFANGFFSGTIHPNDAVTEQPLHFFFLGNSELKSDTIVNQTTSLSIDIADQSENLPVLSYGASNELYTGPNNTYSTTLKNKCAMVRFDLANTGDYEVTLSNVPTLATVNFANPTAETAIVATEGQTNANMTLYGEEGNTAIRWAILLPGTNLTTGHGDLNITYSGDVNLAELAYNDYINSGISINNPLPLPDAPDAQYAVKTSDGTLTQFSVSANKKVYFSRANLKCNAANPNQLVWDFHEYQYDECPGFGTINSTSGTGTNGIHITSSDEMDRFSWGFHSPTTISEDDWVDGSRDLSRADGTDWGCALSGTAYGDNWRTLTAAEWQYLLSSRSGKRFVRVTWKQMHPVNSNFKATNGIIIAPDGYNGGSASSWTEWNNASKIKSTNSTVVTALLNDGCVFLPALGYRQGSYYYEYNYHYTNGVYMIGNYWTATGVEQQPGSTVTPQAKAFRFEDDKINYAYSPQRNLGMCVRLVWDAN